MLIGQVKNVGLEGENGGYTSYEFFTITNLDIGRGESRVNFSSCLVEYLIDNGHDGSRTGYYIYKKEYNVIGEL